MTTQIGGLSVAIRNANDGVSVAQTAEGAMAEMTTNLNRAHDLAVQAASYNTGADRNSINQEVTQILDEMSRIVNQTRYNGDKLLTGGFNGDHPFAQPFKVNRAYNLVWLGKTPQEILKKPPPQNLCDSADGFTFGGSRWANHQHMLACDRPQNHQLGKRLPIYKAKGRFLNTLLKIQHLRKLT